jgi:uncharacterized protein involved in exopolysaccharide biosynthesis
MQVDSGGRQGNPGVLDLRHYLLVVWKRKWLILAVLGVTVGSAWVFQAQQTPIFQATATVMIEPEPPRVMNIQDVTPGGGSSGEYYATQYRVITSRPIAEATIDRLKLKDRIPAIGRSRDPVRAFTARAVVTPVRATRLVGVGFQLPDPELAAEVANALAAEYVRYNLNLKHRTAQEAVVWLNEQIQELRAKATKSSAALQAYQTKADILGIQEQRQLTQSKIIDVNRSYTDAQNQRLTMESKLRELTAAAKDPNAVESVMRMADDPMILKLKNEASDLLAQRARLSQLYREKHPDLVVLDAQIKLANQRMQAELTKMLQALETQVRVLRGREEALLAQVNELRRDAQRLTAQEAQARALDVERASTEELHAAVLKRVNEAGLATALDASNIRVVEPALPPHSPVYPRTELIMIMSLIGGLGLGVGAAFVVEYLDDRVRSPEDIERTVGVPVLGIVPVFSAKRDA